jgi:LSD1 subclass zinc finger protein
MSSLQVSCPQCRTVLQLPRAGTPGAKIRCLKCQTVFPLPAPPVPPEVVPLAQAIATVPLAQAVPMGPRAADGGLPFVVPIDSKGTSPLLSPFARKVGPIPLVLIFALAGGFILFVLGMGVLGAVIYAVKGSSKPAVAVNKTPVVITKRTAAKIQPTVNPAPGAVALAGPPPPWAANPDPSKPSAATAKRTAWLKRNLSDAYEKSGKKNPAWDPAARDILRLTGESWNDQMGRRAELTEAFGRAEQAGCNDGLVLFAVGRFYNNTYPHDRAAELMEKSAYHPALRCLALIRAAEAVGIAAPDQKGIDRVAHNLDAALELLPEAAKDKDIPDSILLSIVQRLEIPYMRHRMLSRDRKLAFDRIHAQLAKGRPNSSILATYEGTFYTSYAWDSRGSGWANTVTPEGWKGFHERLAKADASLMRAWDLDNSNAQGPTAMLTVEMGQGQGRVRLENWFEKAMKADPDNIEACERKLLYLQPKWYGSEDDALGFGRECLRTGNWQARLPFILVQAHEQLAGGPGAAGNYFQRPGVWDDIRAVFTGFLERNPKSATERSRFAMYACKCGAWDEANRQFTQLGNQVEWWPFGSVQEMERLHQEAVQRGGKK